MNAGQFARKRGRIEHARRGRGWRKRALLKLIQESDAVPVFINRKLVAYRIPSGGHVCVKHRYPSILAANLALSDILRHGHGQKMPQRAYPCPYCGGAHLTSKPKKDVR